MARNSEQPIRCSFCGKRENQTSKMIAGPGVYICSDCVHACNDLLRDEIEQKGQAQTSNSRNDKKCGNCSRLLFMPT